jgi:hypothetical protein
MICMQRTVSRPPRPPKVHVLNPQFRSKYQDKYFTSTKTISMVAKRKTSKNKTICKSAKALSKDGKEFMASCVEHIAKKIVTSRSGTGRTPRGFAEKLLQEGKKIFPSMSMNMINYAVKKAVDEKDKRPKLFKSNIEVDKETILSSLTGNSKSNTTSSLSSKPDIGNEATSALLMLKNSTSDSASSKSSNDSASTCDITIKDANPSIQDFIDITINKNDMTKSIGRPKGSTAAATVCLKEKIELATKEATDWLANNIKSQRSHKNRAAKGLLKEVIESAKQKHGVPDDVDISVVTVRQRVKRKSNNGHRGQKTPMIEVEPYLVDLIKKVADMRQPITAAQGLQLANSLINQKSTQKAVTEWRKRHCKAFKDGGGKIELGKGYWRSFLKRNRHLIRTKKAVKFDNKRAEWCNYLNMKLMYDEIYKDFCCGGIAVEHPEPVWRNEAGEVVESEEQAFGLKSKYELIHPDWLLFVDEVGSNTSQAKDGNVGGQLYLCSVDGRPQQRAATKDAHFTVLGFTAADGQPVMCSIIFAAKTFRDEWRTGFDPFANWVGEPDDIAANCGDGKQYPFGPVCLFKGKTIPCFCCCSESGSITTELLTRMLKKLDELEVFDRSTGLNPFLILDGHGSRFELEFLEYINTCETKWNVNIGLPYGTSYWQVGDSTEQNGCFKMALTKAKQSLVTAKNDSGLPFEINKTDVVKLVKEAWNASFSRVETNQKAVLERGWGPKALNYNVLLHPEISASNPDNDGSSGDQQNKMMVSNLHPRELNLTEGLSGTLIDRIVLHSNKESRTSGKSVAEVMIKRKENARKQLENHEKRCSAGLIAGAGMFKLNEDILGFVRKTREVHDAKAREKLLKAKEIYDSLLKKVEAIRQKNLPPEKWTSGELNTMLQWFKRPSDTAMPNKKSDKLARYRDICGRAEPQPPELPQDLMSDMPPLPPPPPPLPVGQQDTTHGVMVVAEDAAAIEDETLSDQEQALFRSDNGLAMITDELNDEELSILEQVFCSKDDVADAAEPNDAALPIIEQV